MRMDAAIRYRCEVCGYVYDPYLGDPLNGVAAKTPFKSFRRTGTALSVRAAR